MYRDPVQSLEAPLLPSTATAMRPLRVGMIGIGTVGAGTRERRHRERRHPRRQAP